MVLTSWYNYWFLPKVLFEWSNVMKKKKYVKEFIHPTDPGYLDAFYSDWGAGQSVTHRQTPDSEGQTEKLQKQLEPQPEPDPS